MVVDMLQTACLATQSFHPRLISTSTVSLFSTQTCRVILYLLGIELYNNSAAKSNERKPAAHNEAASPASVSLPHNA